MKGDGIYFSLLPNICILSNHFCLKEAFDNLSGPMAVILTEFTPMKFIVSFFMAL